MTVFLDAGRLNSPEEAHDYLQEELALPGYYGKNLDALFDCLGEFQDLEVVFQNCGNADGYFEKVYRVFQKACEENTSLCCRRV